MRRVEFRAGFCCVVLCSIVFGVGVGIGDCHGWLVHNEAFITNRIEILEYEDEFHASD